MGMTTSFHVCVDANGSSTVTRRVIGLATAQLLAERGAILSLSDVNYEGLQKVVKSLPGEGHFATELDVREGAKVTAWIEDSAKRLGGLDGAANVAGVEREGGRHLAESTDEALDFVMGINAGGVFSCTCVELQQMLKNGGGSIVSENACHTNTSFFGISTDGHSSTH
jgi:NAD(P)-dependent dehydrogenase (short-subunit alcohol dehydrogenase family)